MALAFLLFFFLSGNYSNINFKIKCYTLQYLNENPFGEAATFKFNFKCVY